MDPSVCFDVLQIRTRCDLSGNQTTNLQSCGSWYQFLNFYISFLLSFIIDICLSVLLFLYLTFCFSFHHVCLLPSISLAFCHSLLFSPYSGTDRHKLTTAQYIQDTRVTSHTDACLRHHVSVRSYSLSLLRTIPSVGCSCRMHFEVLRQT